MEPDRSNRRARDVHIAQGRRQPDKTEVFADGWLDPETKQYRGRPVDVAMLPDGSMLVSDDFAGALYRIVYTGE